jgi:hypothetical protein
MMMLFPELGAFPYQEPYIMFQKLTYKDNITYIT